MEILCRQKSSKEGILTIEFDLKDTGEGHTKAELKTIFGDFVQAESMSLRNSDGSSVGTVLAGQLVKIMGGTLCSSSPSGLSDDPARPGTRILITLPLYSNERVRKNYDSDAVKSFGDIRALLIYGVQSRDEDLNAILHRIGIQTVVTSWHKSTINQINANYNAGSDRYNMIILTDDDDLSGFEVAGALLDNGLHLKYPIIMVSSNDKKGNYLKCINLGVDHYLVKPVSSDELEEAIFLTFSNITDFLHHHDLRSLKSELEILVVEDNKINSLVTGRMLLSLGYKPDFATDGAMATKLAAKKRYDLILMDLVMPEMDGYEAAKKILARDKTILIVALTADNMPESIKKAELSGIKEFISKPVRIEELKRLFARYFMKS